MTMARYTVAVLRDFIAQHFLIGGDWGRENTLHSHHYKVELCFSGDELDRHGYLLDIAVVSEHLERAIERYREKTLNELPEFEARNPSLELFARLFTERFLHTSGTGVGALDTSHLSALTTKLWEHEQAFATFTHRFR